MSSGGSQQLDQGLHNVKLGVSKRTPKEEKLPASKEVS